MSLESEEGLCLAKPIPTENISDLGFLVAEEERRSKRAEIQKRWREKQENMQKRLAEYSAKYYHNNRDRILERRKEIYHEKKQEAILAGFDTPKRPRGRPRKYNVEAEEKI